MRLLGSKGLILRHRLLLEWLALLIGGCLLAIWSQHSGLTGRVDTRLLDSATVLARPDVSQDIIIVAIDDASLAEVGPWPWPRGTHARIVDRLADAGASQIVYDVLFLDRTEGKADARLASAISDAGNVILPHTFGATPDTVAGISPVYPFAELKAAARGVGHVAADPDEDGALRRFSFGLAADGASHPQMIIAALNATAEDSGQKIKIPAQIDGTWPVIPFNPAGSFATISASEVLHGRVPPSFLSGKVAIVGAVAQGMGDRYSVPVGNVTLMAGVETQANLFNSLTAGQYVSEARGQWVVLAAIAALFIQFVAFWRTAPKFSLVVTAGLMAAILAGSFLLVPAAQIWLAPGTALLVLALSYPLWSWRRLVSVSAFLETEAKVLLDVDAEETRAGGFDIIARQVSRMQMLVRGVKSNLQFLTQIIETVPDPIVVLDEDGRAQLWNRNASLLFRDWKLAEHPHFSELFISGNVSVDKHANEISTADGRTFLLAKGRLDSDNRNSKAEVIALREITKMRQQEGERQQTLEFLSHDMRTPQAAIIGLTQRSSGPIDPDERLERIAVQAHRTLKLADDFVQLARLEEANLTFEEADLAALVQEACDRTFVVCRARNISIIQDIPDDMVLAEIEPSMIARLLDNLLGNAIKFSPPGGRVTVRLAEIQSGTNSGVKQIALSVSDNGLGLPPERIADPFARFGAQDTNPGPSAGLGLTFVKRAVEKHHGRIEVISDPDHGTEFVMHFPERQPQQKPE